MTCGTVDAATLTITWDPSVNPTVAGYKVAYGIKSGAYTNEIDTGTQTVFQIANLTAGGTYFFIVRAYDGTGNLSSPSSEVKDVAPLSTPLSLTCQAKAATSSDGAPVAIAFSPAASGGVSPVTTTCAPQSGSQFKVGTTSVQCTAKDAAGATASCAGAVVISLAAAAASSPSSVSPDGTHVPSASQIVDAAGAIYTLKNASPFPMIMRNGVQFAGAFGTAIAWCGGRIYVRGDDAQWYLSTTSGSTASWALVGASDPCATASTPTAAPTPTPTAASPDRTHVPTASQIVDAAGNNFTLQAAKPFPKVMKNGVQFEQAFGTALAWCSGQIYILGDDARWWRPTQSGSAYSWTQVGKTDPCPAK